MLRIHATAFPDQSFDRQLVADFDEMGGKIGRSEGNTLVLPDDKRYISRTQAAISFRAGQFYVLDQGSATPTIVNGAPVGNGKEVVLAAGDEIRIGDYVLQVSISAPAHGLEDPFADLLPPAQSPPIGARPSPSLPDLKRPFDDPLGATPPSHAGSIQSGAIPHDFDPFADLLPAGAAPKAEPVPDLNFASSSDQSVDEVFGLKGSADWDPLGPADPLAGYQGGPDIDPFASPVARPPQANPYQRDDSPMLSAAFPRPQPIPEPRPKLQRQPDQAPAPPLRQAPAAEANKEVVSWDNVDVIQKTIIRPTPKPPQAGVDRGDPQNPPAMSRSTPAPPPTRPSAAASGDQPREDALLQAFLTGAGVADLKLPAGMTPELMNLIGQLFRESMSGTLELLLARRLTKQEIRAQATVIVAKENNPLKFSPNVEAALGSMLAPQSHGFMSPVNAMRDAYNDLRSHQFGFMAGMRAALEGVLARFDPAQLESRLSQKGVLNSLMPSNRRAKLWELYERLYREISKEAEDDFQALFGKAFLAAYEAQIEKLDQEESPNRR